MQTKKDVPRRVGLWSVYVLASGRVQIWSPFCLSGPAADWEDKPGTLTVALKIVAGLNAPGCAGGCVKTVNKDGLPRVRWLWDLDGVGDPPGWFEESYKEVAMAKKTKAITRARPQATPHLHFIRDDAHGEVRVWFSGDPGDVFQIMPAAEFDHSWRWATERYPLLFVEGPPDADDGTVECAVCAGVK